MDDLMMHKGMSINETVKRYPETIAIFEKYGLSCIGCRAALFVTIEQAAKIYGINMANLLKDLNQTVSKNR